MGNLKAAMAKMDAAAVDRELELTDVETHLAEALRPVLLESGHSPSLCLVAMVDLAGQMIGAAARDGVLAETEVTELRERLDIKILAAQELV